MIRLSFISSRIKVALDYVPDIIKSLALLRMINIIMARAFSNFS